MREKWLKLLRRDEKHFEPNFKQKVCSLHFTSLHFVDGCPTKEHPYPELFVYNNVSQMTTQYGTSIPLGLRSSGTFMKLQTARSTATSTTIEDLTLDTDIQHLGIYSR
jgi:hypothetical protein